MLLGWYQVTRTGDPVAFPWFSIVFCRSSIVLWGGCLAHGQEKDEKDATKLNFSLGTMTSKEAHNKSWGSPASKLTLRTWLRSWGVGHTPGLPSPRNLADPMWQNVAKPRRNAHCPLIITPNGHSVWFSTAQLVYPMVYSIVYHIAAGWPLGKSLTVTLFIDRIGDGRASHPKLCNLGISNSNMDFPSKLLHAWLKPRMSYLTSKTQKENDVSRSLSNRFK